MTAEKKIVTPVLAACQNQNFGRRVTHHMACRIERNCIVHQDRLQISKYNVKCSKKKIFKLEHFLTHRSLFSVRKSTNKDQFLAGLLLNYLYF